MLVSFDFVIKLIQTLEENQSAALMATFKRNHFNVHYKEGVQVLSYLILISPIFEKKGIKEINLFFFFTEKYLIKTILYNYLK